MSSNRQNPVMKSLVTPGTSRKVIDSRPVTRSTVPGIYISDEVFLNFADTKAYETCFMDRNLKDNNILDIPECSTCSVANCHGNSAHCCYLCHKSKICENCVRSKELCMNCIRTIDAQLAIDAHSRYSSSTVSSPERYNIHHELPSNHRKYTIKQNIYWAYLLNRRNRLLFVPSDDIVIIGSQHLAISINELFLANARVGGHFIQTYLKEQLLIFSLMSGEKHFERENTYTKDAPHCALVQLTRPVSSILENVVDTVVRLHWVGITNQHQLVSSTSSTKHVDVLQVKSTPYDLVFRCDYPVVDVVVEDCFHPTGAVTKHSQQYGIFDAVKQQLISYYGCTVLFNCGVDGYNTDLRVMIVDFRQDPQTMEYVTMKANSFLFLNGTQAYCIINRSDRVVNVIRFFLDRHIDSVRQPPLYIESMNDFDTEFRIVAYENGSLETGGGDKESVSSQRMNGSDGSGAASGTMSSGEDRSPPTKDSDGSGAASETMSSGEGGDGLWALLYSSDDDGFFETEGGDYGTGAEL